MNETLIAHGRLPLSLRNEHQTLQNSQPEHEEHEQDPEHENAAVSTQEPTAAEPSRIDSTGGTAGDATAGASVALTLSM
jgi:hypothetical protein